MLVVGLRIALPQADSAVVKLLMPAAWDAHSGTSQEKSVSDTTIPVRIISPQQLKSAGELPAFPIEQFPKRFLAQGDSWFSIGAIPPHLTTNLLLELELAAGTCIVNCASPGQTLHKMTNTTRNPVFLNLLRGRTAFDWDAILISGGGNDLIAALESRDPAPALRILATEAERGDSALGAVRYLSPAGLLTFSDHLRAVFSQLVQARDSGRNAGKPIVFHTYDLAVPRDADAGFGFGPWLSAAFTAFAIPPADWTPVARELFAQMHQLLTAVSQQFPSMVLVDTLGTLQMADANATGPSGDWQNEIHPTRRGYDKLGERWKPVLNGL